MRVYLLCCAPTVMAAAGAAAAAEPPAKRAHTSTQAYRAAAASLPPLPSGPLTVDACLSGRVAWVSNLDGLPLRCAQGNYLVHSGPRCTGKSTHLAMMEAYFHRDERLLQHLRELYQYTDAKFLRFKCPVVHLQLDFAVPPHYTDQEINAEVTAQLCQRLVTCAAGLGVEAPADCEGSVELTLGRLVHAVAAKYTAPEWGRPAFLVDDLDFCLLRAVAAGVGPAGLHARVNALGPLWGYFKQHFDSLHSVFMTGETLLFRGLGSAHAWLNAATILTFPELYCAPRVPRLGFTWAQITQALGRHLAAFCTAADTDLPAVQRRMTALYGGYGDRHSPELFDMASVLAFLRTGDLRAHSYIGVLDSGPVARVATAEVLAQILAPRGPPPGGLVLRVEALRMQDGGPACPVWTTEARAAFLVQCGLLAVDHFSDDDARCVVRLPNEAMRSALEEWKTTVGAMCVT